MFNNVGRINLNNIPRGPRDVVAVELLYTESISTTIYVLETIDIPVTQRGQDYILSDQYVSGDPFADTMPGSGDHVRNFALLPLSYSLSARKIYSALPANQLTRPYDEVPQRALAQEITANRLVYGNYQIGFDQPEALDLTTSLISAGDGDGLHVKGNRTYEIGVAYIDAYGRQGNMVQAGSITLADGSINEAMPVVAPFHQSGRQQIQATINSTPPAWADRYRYFIKDPAMDHHSLISYNIYNDGGADDTNSEFVWIEFQSTDRNKVQAEDATDQGTVLVLRRSNDTVATTKQRFLVQDIQNEAPEDVRRQVREVVSNTRAVSSGAIASNLYNTSGTRPTTGSNTWTWVDQGGNLQSALNVFNRFVQGNQNTENPSAYYNYHRFS